MNSLRLAALEPEDLDLLYTIENDGEMWSIGNTNVPYSRYALRDYIANQQFDIFTDKQVRLVIRVGEPGVTAEKAVGLIDLFNFSPEHSRAEMGLAVLKEEQGKGYATESIGLLADYALNVVHLHQIYCIVPADNKPSLAMLRNNGFTNEQVLKDWTRRGEDYADAILLQKFL